ncbi:hypothetical protein tloyanaT_21720 [Thalassotalea loyana]|uniref:Uncharacterized protein n=1 Tax=Thalassotalea loyana TaxID=280483 RepID=A0ABQ6HCS9_9GAMM|nr:hypothetical protein [Thalassotalea loyana]GLX85920.1 hypothetical protein tloyanaT_21720 [Thalassotalea loyana]
MTKYLIIIFTLVASLKVNAIAIVGEIERIYPTRETVYFRLKDDDCISGNQYYYFQMGEQNSTAKYASHNWYALMLAAANTKSKISVSVPSCDSEGHIQVSYIFQDF